jgi:hypothetical protein
MQEGDACMVTAINEERIARHRDNRDGRPLLKAEDRQRSTRRDLEPILDGDLKIGLCQSDPGADNRQLDRSVLPPASDPQADCSVDGPAYLRERLVERHTLRRRIVEMCNDVIGHDVSLDGRGVLDRRQHLEETILHVDSDADAAERLLKVEGDTTYVSTDTWPRSTMERKLESAILLGRLVSGRSRLRDRECLSPSIGWRTGDVVAAVAPGPPLLGQR